MKKTRVNLYLNTEDYLQMKHLAENQGENVSLFIRQAIRDFNKAQSALQRCYVLPG